MSAQACKNNRLYIGEPYPYRIIYKGRPSCLPINFPQGSSILYNIGDKEEDWETGYEENSGTTAKRPGALEACAYPTLLSAQRTWETTEIYDFSQIDEIYVEWENTGSNSINNLSLITVGDKGGSALTGDLIHFKQGSFTRSLEVINVRNFNGEGPLRIHSFGEGDQVESCIKVYGAAFVHPPSPEDLPKVESCTFTGVNVAWVVMIDELEEGKDALITPICSEENFTVKITNNEPLGVVWLSNDQDEQQHGPLIPNWEFKAIRVTHTNFIDPVWLSNDQDEEEHTDIIPGWSITGIIVTNNE